MGPGAMHWTRRHARRPLFAAALAAAGLAGARQPRLAVAAARRAVVQWSPIFLAWSGASRVATDVLMRLAEESLAAFRARHPTIDVRVWGPSQGPAVVGPALLGGSGPDVFADNNIAPYVEQQLLLDLTPYVHQDNVSEGLFATSQLRVFTWKGSVFALPAYVGTVVMLVNEGLLDQMGLGYPQADWTYVQWAQLWSRLAGTLHAAGGPTQRLGTTIYGAPADFYYRGWGARLVEPDGLHCGLDAPAAMDCGQWLFGLLARQVAGTLGQQYQAAFARGTVGTGTFWIQTLPAWVSTLAAMKWNFYPMPLWPAGAATFANSDFWAISAEAPHPEACWELLKELCVGTAFQRTMMRAILFPPALKSLWPEWLRVVRSVAPPLRTKNLAVFADYVLHNQAYPVGVFRFANQQAWSLYGATVAQIRAQRLGVAVGFRQCAQQIDALEQAYAQLPPVSLAAEVGAARKASQRLARMFAQ